MKGTTILLLGAATLVAYASAHPYSKIPDGISLPDEYRFKKSSSNSHSNSYSQSNQDDTDVNGSYRGQTFSGSKSSGFSSSGGSHSQSSSFASSSINGNVPLPILGGSGFSGLSQNANRYSEPTLALGNPGTADLHLSNKGSGFASGSGSSYGHSNPGLSPGSFDAQINQGALNAGSSGSYNTAGLGSIQSGSNQGHEISSSGSNSEIYGSNAGETYGQAVVPISGSGYSGQAGSQPGAVQYWWNGPDSPFGPAGKPSGGCTSNACSLAGTFDLNRGSGGAHASNQGGQVGLNINGGNPFFGTGGAGSGSGFVSSGASIGQNAQGSGSGSGSAFGAGSGSTLSSRPIDGSKNPFLNGGYTGSSSGSGFSSGSGAFASAGAGAGSSGSFGASSSSGVFTGAGNPFLTPGSGSGQIPQGFGPSSTATPGYSVAQGTGLADAGAGSINPFFKPGSGSVVITPPVTKFTGQSNQGFPQPSPLPGFPSPSANSGSLFPQQTTQDNFPQKGSLTPGYPGSAGAGDFQGQIGQIPSFPSQSTIGFGSSAGYPGTSTSIQEQESSGFDGGLTVSCSGQGKICVLKGLCENGRVSGNVQGLTQVRTEPQLCKVGREVCCSLNGYSGSSSTNLGGGQGSIFSSSGSTASSLSGAGGNYGGLSSASGKPVLSGSTGNYGQSTGTQGQSSQFGSSGNYDQSGQYEQSGSSGSSGIFGQTGQSGSADSYDQTQQKESFNFDAQSSSKGSAGSGSTFGNRGGIGFTQEFPSPSPSGTPASGLIQGTQGSAFRKPTGGSFTGGNSGFASASASANAAATGQAGSGSYVQSAPASSNTGIFGNNKKQGPLTGGLFGSSDNSGEDLGNGESNYRGSGNGVKGSSASNGYLPPIGSEPSDNVPAFSNPPKEDSGPTNPIPEYKRPQTFPPAPISVQVGCAAALICVEERFCTLEGVISPQPVALTSQQIERRAPLSSCKNPDNGIIGKCCRDPNYVDPWPTGNLPANYSGGFDEQGFPTYLNIAKTRPPTRQPAPTKGGFRQPVKGYPAAPKPTGKGWWEDLTAPIQNFISPQGTDKPIVTGEQPQNPDGSYDETQATENPASGTTPPNFFGITLPNFGTFPTFPNFTLPTLPNFTLPDSFSNPFQNPAGSKNYDSSASNQSPTIIAQHTPGVQCGLRNKVQRPSGLDFEDVAFGEIPWQAMVLSTKDRKLLCSGAFVAPNAVLTAAHCVDGFKSGEVSVKAGEWKLGYELKHEEPLPFEIVTVSNIVPHPGFRAGSPSHDFAILFLEYPVKLDQHVDVLCLGDIPQPKPGRKCISTGWGKIVLQVNVAGALMHGIDVDVLPQDVCRQRLQGAESQIEVDNTLTCVKAHNQRNNMCQVDVGGPLACDRGDGYYELTGVYSQDTGCLPTNQVATFALIDTNWVKKNLASPPRVPSYEIGVPNVGELSSPTYVKTQFEGQVKQPAATCDCQKSNLPPELNQYLPPV